MSRYVLYLAVLLVLSACGSPTSPGSIQSNLDMATPDLKVNGATIQPGSTTNVGVGSRVDFQVNYTNHSGQYLHTGLLLVRDDGVERLLRCGASGRGGQGGGFGVGTTISAQDRGHTLRVLLLGAYSPDSSSGPQAQCLFQLSPGSFEGVNHANVQAERLLVTLAVQ